MIRLFLTYASLLGATVFTGGRVVLYHAFFPRRFKRLADDFTGEWATLVLRGTGTRVQVRHRDRLGRGRGQILVANHQSVFDIFVLGSALRRQFSFVGKKEVSGIPVVGAAWEKVGHIAIDRSDRQSAISSLAQADKQLRNGRTIIFFPEGTRSPTGRLGRFKKGAFVLAIKQQVPVLPVAILGTRQIMEKGSWKIRPGRVTVVVGEPVSTEGLTTRDRDRLSRECRTAVESLMNGGHDEGDDPCPR